MQEKHNVATKDSTRTKLKVTAWDLAKTESAAAKSIQQEVDKFWREGRYGNVLKQKPANAIRVVLENFNSLLEVFTGPKNNDQKANTVDRLCCHYDVDFFAGTEPQADWRFAPEERQFKNLIGKGHRPQSVVGYNSMKGVALAERSQIGSKCLMVFHRFASFVNVRYSGSSMHNQSWPLVLNRGGRMR